MMISDDKNSPLPNIGEEIAEDCPGWKNITETGNIYNAILINYPVTKGCFFTDKIKMGSDFAHVAINRINIEDCHNKKKDDTKEAQT